MCFACASHIPRVHSCQVFVVVQADALVRGVDNLAVPLYQQAVAFIDAAVAGSRVLPSSSPAESATPSFEEAAAKLGG